MPSIWCRLHRGCEKNVDLICGRYIVDAKSMLGVFSLPTFDDVELGVEEEDEEKLRKHWKV